jgi:hypothetical protein
MADDGARVNSSGARSVEDLVSEQRLLLLAIDAELQRFFEDGDPSAFERLKGILRAQGGATATPSLSNGLATIALERKRHMARTATYFGADLTAALAQLLQFAEQIVASDQKLSSTCFDEAYYLAQHEDVAAHVRAGGLRSGFEHWIFHGIAEQRKSRFLSEKFDFAGQAAAVRAAYNRSRTASLSTRLKRFFRSR